LRNNVWGQIFTGCCSKAQGEGIEGRPQNYKILSLLLFAFSVESVYSLGWIWPVYQNSGRGAKEISLLGSLGSLSFLGLFGFYGFFCLFCLSGASTLLSILDIVGFCFYVEKVGVTLIGKSDMIFHIVKANHKLVKNTTPPQYILTCQKGFA